VNPRLTAILVLIFIALAIFAYTLRNQEPRELGKGTPTPTPGPLMALEPAAVQELGVVGAGGSYTLTRVAGGWQVDGQPASTEVDGVVNAIVKPTVLRELPSDRNPDDYGFAQPALTLTLRTAPGETKVLQVGDDTPVDPNVYIRLAGDRRLVIIANSDTTRLKDWIGQRPLAPTPTPGGTEAPGAAATELLPELPLPLESPTP
jgi:hypothetical protein